ncbi:MAG: hypothetical protein GY847_34310 [Proteobacteria bacterium]|nr:hypothetical protein [Pseudomonadota bacterium]
MVESKVIGRIIWLWALIPIIAAAEIAFQWHIPRKEPSANDWKAVVAAVKADKKDSDLVVVAPDWALPVGRMHFGSLISHKDFGRFDTTTYNRLFEVSLNGARAKETEDLTPQTQTEFGRITLLRYDLRLPRAFILYDFVDTFRGATAKGYKRMMPRFVIDHWFFPRFVIPVKLKQKGVNLIYKDVPLGGVLRGYGIVGYRSGRFNRGGPVTVSAFLNEEKLGEDQIHNFGPLRPFEYRLPGQGSGTVRFRISARNGLSREFGFAADVRKKASAGVNK